MMQLINDLATLCHSMQQGKTYNAIFKGAANPAELNAFLAGILINFLDSKGLNLNNYENEFENAFENERRTQKEWKSWAELAILKFDPKYYHKHKTIMTDRNRRTEEPNRRTVLRDRDLDEIRPMPMPERPVGGWFNEPTAPPEHIWRTQ